MDRLCILALSFPRTWFRCNRSRSETNAIWKQETSQLTDWTLWSRSLSASIPLRKIKKYGTAIGLERLRCETALHWKRSRSCSLALRIMREPSKLRTFPHCDRSDWDRAAKDPTISITSRLFFEVFAVLRFFVIDLPNLEELRMGSDGFGESLHTVMTGMRCDSSTN